MELRKGNTDKENEFIQAAHKGDLETVKSLQAEGIDINVRSKYNGMTALNLAVAHGYDDIFDYLMEQKEININKACFLNKTPIMNAIKHYNDHAKTQLSSRSDLVKPTTSSLSGDNFIPRM